MIVSDGEALGTRPADLSPQGRCPTLAPASVTSLAFVRPSRHDGAPHQVLVDPATLRPFSCTCLAGTHGRLCWAGVDVAAHDLEPIAHSRWAAAARELAALRSSGYVLTDRGRAAIRGTESVVA